MGSLIDNLRSLGKLRLAILGAVGIGIAVTVTGMALLLARPQMGTLYSGLDPAEAGRILQAAEALGVPIEAAYDGTTLQVPQGEIARVRMMLAEQGLPSAGGAGYELFDDDGALGMTSFMQKVNRLRALEGELARTIQTLRGVEAARVHLVLPDREAFAREPATPTGSVVVRMRGQAALDRTQALSIRHLVASAVPGLKPASVTVMDATGQLLFAEEDGTDMSVARAEGQRAQMEMRLTRNIEQLLAARLGPGNVRVTVAAELDLRREVRREQHYDPNGQVVRSTQTVEETERSKDLSGAAPTTVEQNLPFADLADPSGENSSSSEVNRLEETVNYELSGTQSEVVQEPGTLRRLAVAVLVNGTYATDADGNSVYEPRSEAELQQIRNLVQSAIGFDAERGDTLTVENLEFVDPVSDLAPLTGPSLGDVLTQNIMTLIQWLVLLIVATLLILLGLRPLLARLFPQPGPDAAEARIEDQAVELPQLPSPDEEEEPVSTAAAIEEAVDNMIELRAVEGRVHASSVRKLGDIVDQYPEEAISILRSWLYEDAA